MQLASSWAARRHPVLWRSNVTDYFGGNSREDVEVLLRRLITQGAEGPKVDFKTTWSVADKAAQAELAKDVSSIANTDDEIHLQDFGYIILGAQRGKIIGGISELSADPDKLQAQLTDVIKNFVGPVPLFSIVAFEDPSVGRWGAVVIPPSGSQPHLLVRDGANGVVKHEWWVRVNDTSERAGPHDWARVMAKRLRREVRPLEVEVQRLALLVEQRPAFEVGALAEMLRNTRVENAQRPADLATSVRQLLVRGNAVVEDMLIAEALRIERVMAEDTAVNPISFMHVDADGYRAILEHLEEQTFPMIDALAAIARYDREGLLTDAACRAFQLIAKEPEPMGTHYTNIAQFRLYPLVLCLYAVVVVAANEQRGQLLNGIFNLKLRTRSEASPIIVALRRIRSGATAFQQVIGAEYFEPIAMRVRDVLMPRLSGVLVGTPSREAFAIAEFVLALAYLKVSPTIHHESVPWPGLYVYESEAVEVITRFLQGRPNWVGVALEITDLAKLLADFDASARRLVNPRAWGDGFTRGAIAAYDGSKNA